MRVSGVRVHTLFHAYRIQWVACPSQDYAYHLRDCASLSAADATERLTPKHSGKIKLLAAKREKLDAALLIVGARLAGVACALWLSQLFREHKRWNPPSSFSREITGEPTNQGLRM